MHHAKLPVSPSLAIVKAKSIASSLSILESDFKASWQWLSRFRAHRELQKILLHEKGAKVDKQSKIASSFRRTLQDYRTI
jgi:hypothetical protein